MLFQNILMFLPYRWLHHPTFLDAFTGFTPMCYQGHQLSDRNMWSIGSVSFVLVTEFDLRLPNKIQ